MEEFKITYELIEDISAVFNKHGVAPMAGSPNHILADYVLNCVRAYIVASTHTVRYYAAMDADGGRRLSTEEPKR